MPDKISSPVKTSGGSGPSLILPQKTWLYPLLAAFLLAVLFGIRLTNDADMGFHLKSGQWILQNHGLPTPDHFTYTRSGQEYLDMEWLYQVPLYLGYRLGGYPLVSLAHIVLALLAFGLLWGRLRAGGAPHWMAVLLFIAAVLASEPRFRVRPEILTWVLLSATLWILELRLNRRGDFLFLLPFLQWFWVNTEGLFFIGLALMVFHLLAGLAHDRKIDSKLLKISFFSLALCLLNPHFLKGLFFPFSFLSTLGATEIFKYTVKEFQPPWSFPVPSGAPYPDFLVYYKLFSFSLLFLFLATFKKRKIHEWLLALFFFALSASAVRNIPLFMLACVPLAAACWNDLEWLWLKKIQDSLVSKPAIAIALTLFLFGFSARVVTNAHYVDNRLTDRFGLGLDLKAQPMEACEFLARNHLEGRIINDLDSGDWLDWQGPQKTFIDGRLDVMGKEFFSEYIQSQWAGGAAALIAEYRPDIFFLNPLLVPQWAADLSQMPDWRLVYLDSVTAVYLRKGYVDQIPTLDYNKLLNENGITPSILSEAPSLLQIAPPSAWDLFAEGFIRPCGYPNDLLNLGIFCGNNGNPATAELFFLEAIRRTGGRYYDFYYNLGLLYAYLGRRSEAALCMQRVLREKPGDPMAHRILGM